MHRRDALAFGALPPALRTSRVALWWADGTVGLEPHVACGSPGEAANDAALGPTFLYHNEILRSDSD